MENEQTTKKNPHLMEAGYKRYDHPIARWRRLYDAWVMVESEKSEVLLNG